MPYKDPERQTQYWKDRYAKYRDVQLAAARRWREKNPEKVRAANERWKRNNPERRKEVARNSYYRRRERAIAYRRQKRTGASPELYAALLKKQNGKCAICDKTAKLYVDHDHKKKRVRELLCRNCNWALGHFFESIDIMMEAIAYVRKHSAAG